MIETGPSEQERRGLGQFVEVEDGWAPDRAGQSLGGRERVGEHDDVVPGHLGGRYEHGDAEPVGPPAQLGRVPRCLDHHRGGAGVGGGREHLIGEFGGQFRHRHEDDVPPRDRAGHGRVPDRDAADLAVEPGGRGDDVEAPAPEQPPDAQPGGDARLVRGSIVQSSHNRLHGSPRPRLGTSTSQVSGHIAH